MGLDGSKRMDIGVVKVTSETQLDGNEEDQVGSTCYLAASSNMYGADRQNSKRNMLFYFLGYFKEYPISLGTSVFLSNTSPMAPRLLKV
ncbi:Uncharacterized protein TCM_036060 [Theobroma cacao]|uniref:Uncharacterized protein n=1 Tax=Theobroma cacao TaxID=3641 RepID=A0A061FR12_THECC|nr:Uncharacterized protein TCM_036060 [Theobroma cacao]